MSRLKCTLACHNISVAKSKLLYQRFGPCYYSSCWVGDEHSTIVARTSAPKRKYLDCWPLLGVMPKVNKCLMVHPAGLQVLVQCNLTRSTLVKVKSGLPTAPGRLYGLNACIYKQFTYQRGYCLCAVTGLSGNGTQTFFLCLFNSLSSCSLNLVASSFSTTEMPVSCQHTQAALIEDCINLLVCGKYNLYPAPLAL